jgi:E1A-binding protein p400
LEEADASKRMAEVLDRQKAEQPLEPEVGESIGETSQGSTDASAPSVNNKAVLGILESALAAAEDETDVAAARTVRAEAAAEMAEFDESAPLGGGEEGENSVVDGEIKRAEAELLSIEDQVCFI